MAKERFEQNEGERCSGREKIWIYDAYMSLAI